MIHVMLPVQYLRAPGERRMEPHKRDRRAYEQARDYLASRDRSWPFSFENLCEAVGLDPGSLRQELTKGTPA